MDNDSLLQRASNLAENGNFDLARKYVIQAIKNNPADVEAWWAMSHVAKTDKERMRAVNKVLEIEPNHAHALHLRDQIMAGSVPSLGGASAKTSTNNVDMDFMAKALITLVGYFFMYIVGLGLNIYFLHDAKQIQQQTGEKPENVGCLWALLAVAVGFPVGLCTLVVGFTMVAAVFSV